MKLPVPVYGKVPPVADTVTVVVPPKQAMLPDPEEAERTVGCVTDPLAMDVHPFASVTV